MKKMNSQLEKELAMQSHQNFEKPKKRRRFIGKIILLLLFFVILLAGYFSFRIATAPEDEKSGGVYTQIKHLISSSNKKMLGEEEDRINILLLGIGGENHIGPLLTDTLILMSIKPSTQKVSLMSIPRDLLVDIPTVGKGKINHAYALIEVKKPGFGGQVVSSIIENIFSLPVHYYLRIDFEGFIGLVDELGGITVNVEHTLDDPYYPVPGKEDATTSERYEHLIVEKGIRYMNGETALKFVRSRMSNSIEGSDFARSKRQQKILLAIKDKVFSPSTIFNINKLKRTTDLVYEHTDTNLELWEILRLYDIAKGMSSTNIMNVVLDDGPTGTLLAQTIDGAFVLVPRRGDWGELEYIAHNVFDQSKAASLPIHEPTENTPPTNSGREKKILAKQKLESLIEIHNGTEISGLAKQTSDFLTAEGYEVIQFGNAPIQTYKKTLVYDLAPNSENKNSELLKELETLFRGIVFTSGKPTLPQDLADETKDYPVNPKARFLIILGKDWYSIFQNIRNSSP